MHFRILACFAVVAAAGKLQAQRGTPSDSIVQRWRTARPDSAELSSLWVATRSVGGARPLQAVLRRLSDRRSPTLVRLAAIAVLPLYLDPRNVCRVPQLDTLWTPDLHCHVENAAFWVSTSIEPILRDSIRARVRAVALEGGAVGRAADSLMTLSAKLERWNDTQASWCRRTAATFGPALRINATAVLASSEFRELIGCTESGPAAVALAWRGARPDTLMLLLLTRMSSDVRDRRTYNALLAVARDSARAIDDRVAAVDAIGALLHPRLQWFTARDRRNNPQTACPPWLLGTWEAVQEEGGEPMGPGSRRAGAQEIFRLAGEKVPPEVSEAARIVARCALQLLDLREPDPI